MNRDKERLHYVKSNEKEKLMNELRNWKSVDKNRRKGEERMWKWDGSYLNEVK